MERIFAGGVVFFGLVIAADIESISTVAVAFAYLILLSSLMAVGPIAFGRISSLVGAAPTGGNAGSHPGSQVA